MEWQIKIHRKAYRFLEDLHENKRRIIEEKLKELIKALENGVLPYRRLDIRKLRGEWEDFLRIRVGDIRIIFRIDFETKTVYVYHIHYRKSVYK